MYYFCFLKRSFGTLFFVDKNNFVNKGRVNVEEVKDLENLLYVSCLPFEKVLYKVVQIPDSLNSRVEKFLNICMEDYLGSPRESFSTVFYLHKGGREASVFLCSNKDIQESTKDLPSPGVLVSSCQALLSFVNKFYKGNLLVEHVGENCTFFAFVSKKSILYCSSIDTKNPRVVEKYRGRFVDSILKDHKIDGMVCAGEKISITLSKKWKFSVLNCKNAENAVEIGAGISLSEGNALEFERINKVWNTKDLLKKYFTIFASLGLVISFLGTAIYLKERKILYRYRVASGKESPSLDLLKKELRRGPLLKNRLDQIFTDLLSKDKKTIFVKEISYTMDPEVFYLRFEATSIDSKKLFTYLSNRLGKKGDLVEKGKEYELFFRFD